MAALIDIVDENDRPLRGATIQEVRDKGAWHRYIRLLVIDESGRFLLQLRGPQNRIYPECWDFAAAGHVDAGETYEAAAVRELAEEVGLTDVALEEVEYYQTSETYAGQKLNRFNKTFRIRVPIDTPLVIDPDEVLEVRWLTADEVRELVADYPDKVTPALVRLVSPL